MCVVSKDDVSELTGEPLLTYHEQGTGLVKLEEDRGMSTLLVEGSHRSTRKGTLPDIVKGPRVPRIDAIQRK